jgi:hypothetical protein
MTSAEQILGCVRRVGGRVTLSGGRVRCRLPDTSEGHELAEALRRNRDAVMEQLRDEADDAPATRVTEPQTSASSSERWRRDFEFWIPERCRFCEGYWSLVADLHADFIGWNVDRDCDLPSFKALLEEVGIFVEEVRDIDWCYGLVLSRLLPPEMAEARRPRLLVDGRLEIDPVGDD